MSSKRKRTFKEKTYFALKRAFDIFCAFILSILILPLMIIGMIISAISTKSFPIFFDIRVGKNHKIIKVLKLRTMYKDAESNIQKYLTDEQIKSWNEERKIDNDPRVTRIGKILRKTSIDEFPQLINILFGSMSFVGPRPITEFELKNNFNEEEQKFLLSVRPGLTGIWQVYGRSQDTWKSGKRKQYDLDYLKKKSTLFDIKLFILTIPSCLKFLFKK